MKCHKVVYHNFFPEPKVTASYCLFCLTHSPKIFNYEVVKQRKHICKAETRGSLEFLLDKLLKLLVNYIKKKCCQ